MITPELISLESLVAGHVENLLGVQVEMTIAESSERGLFMVVIGRRSLCNKVRKVLTGVGFAWTDRDAETWKSHREVVDFYAVPGGEE